MDTKIFEKVAKKIEGCRDEMIAMEKELIAIPAIGPENGGDGEGRKAKFLEPFLKKYFDTVTECHAPDTRIADGARFNYIALLNGQNGSKTLWLMSHMDIVPAGDEKAWDTPPFEGVVKDGKIYGRGAEDNNQAIVTSLFAARAFRECGITPGINIGVLLVSDEEMGSQEYGAKYILEKMPSTFKKDDLIIVPDGGNPNGDVITVAEKTITWLKITTTGRQSHAAYPYKGINAHRANAHLITMIDQLRENKYKESDPIFDPPISTIEPTKKEANVPNVNTLPGEDVIYFDCRMLPSTDHKLFLNDIRNICAKVEEKFGVKITIEILISVHSPATPNDAPVVKAIQSAVKDLLKRDARPIGIAGGTVCGKIRNKGLHVAAYSNINEMYHQPNEFCTIDNLIADAKIWAHIALSAD